MKTKQIALLMLLALVCVTTYAQRKRVYLNPVQNQVEVATNCKKRIGTTVIMGLSRAKTIEAVMGDTQKDNAALAAEGFDMAISLVVTEAQATQDTELLSDKKKDTYTASLKVEMAMTDVNTGESVAKATISGSSSNKDIQLGYYKAASTFDEEALDFIDNSLPVSGEVTTVEDNSDKEEAKSVRVNIGSAAGVRKDMMFAVYKVQGDAKTEIGKARCEQVINANEALLKVYAAKDGDKTVYDVLQNNDGSYTVNVASRAKKSWGKLGKGIADVFTANKERGNYFDADLNRTAKLKVAVKDCAADNSNVTDNDVKAVADIAAKAFGKVTTIDFIPQCYSSLDAAKEAGLDGLIDITVDNVLYSTEDTKDGKKDHKINLHISLAGINVQTGEWIEMRNIETPASSTESKQKAFDNSISYVENDIRKFAEDVYPVGGLVIDSEKNGEKKKKKETRHYVQEAIINIGSNVGVRKNMMFDIYVQYKEGGADSRLFLGTGKVKGDPSADSAIITVKGNNDGDFKLFELLQNNDGETEAVVISRAHIDRVSTTLTNIGKLF